VNNKNKGVLIMMHGIYGYGLIWMFVFWLILIAIGVYLLVKFIKGDNKSSKNNEKEPLQILQSRLVKGEIDETEYEYLKIILKKKQKIIKKKHNKFLKVN